MYDYEGHYDQVEVYTSIVSVVETIGKKEKVTSEREGDFSVNHDRCQISTLADDLDDLDLPGSFARRI
jgi:hypothetical protein